MSAIHLLVPDAAGIYVPLRFVENYDLSTWNGIDQEDVATIKQGPDQEGYWDAWTNILTSATYSNGGYQYHLHQDGDLWAVDYVAISDAEYKEFFGEERE